MKVCLPTQENNGVNSIVHDHFGSAQYFVVCDTETGEAKALDNRNQHHAHGTCSPLAALGSQPVDAVVVGGIGRRAIIGLNSSNIKVFRSKKGTIQDNIDALNSGELDEITPQNACGGHDNGGGGCR